MCPREKREIESRTENWITCLTAIYGNKFTSITLCMSCLLAIALSSALLLCFSEKNDKREESKIEVNGNGFLCNPTAPRTVIQFLLQIIILDVLIWWFIGAMRFEILIENQRSARFVVMLGNLNRSMKILGDDIKKADRNCVVRGMEVNYSGCRRLRHNSRLIALQSHGMIYWHQRRFLVSF